jgi:hypothetical protein
LRVLLILGSTVTPPPVRTRSIVVVTGLSSPRA